MANKKTARDIVRGILNREHTYRIGRYVQALNKSGYNWSKADVRACLTHMSHERQVTYHMVNSFVSGCLIRRAAEKAA